MDIELLLQKKQLFFKRVLSRLIDLLITNFLIGLFLWLYIALISEKKTDFLFLFIMFSIIGVPIFFFCIYQPILDYFGGTVGKRVMKLIILKKEGKFRPSFWQFFIRGYLNISPFIIAYLFKTISSGNTTMTDNTAIIGFLFSNILGNMWMFINKQNQTVFDLLTGVIVSEKIETL